MVVALPWAPEIHFIGRVTHLLTVHAQRSLFHVGFGELIWRADKVHQEDDDKCAPEWRQK